MTNNEEIPLTYEAFRKIIAKNQLLQEQVLGMKKTIEDFVNYFYEQIGGRQSWPDKDLLFSITESDQFQMLKNIEEEFNNG